MSLSVLAEILTNIGKKRDLFCDLYTQRSTGHFITIEGGRVEELAYGTIEGCGFRLLRGNETHFRHTHGTTANRAIKLIYNTIEPLGINVKLPSVISEKPLITTDGEKISQINSGPLRDLEKVILSESKYIKKVTLKLSTSQKEIAIVASNGNLVQEVRHLTRFAAHVIVEGDGKLFSGYNASGYSAPLNRFLILANIESIALGAAKKALLGLECVPCPGGKMPVVLSGEAGGTMIHEACGHALEGDIVYKNHSLFKDKIGKEVASPAVNLIDDATIKDAFGSYKYDDEGTPSQRTTLIENGVLKAYLSDVFCNKMWGLPLTGNGRRESYMRPPIARMSNTFLLPGSEAPEKIISRVQYGLFAKKMGGGETNPTTGDFVFHVDEGYLIEDGEITVPVKGAILVGNGANVLKNTLAVGNDLGFDAGLCGKNGQYVPVTDGQPTILIKELVVGGSDI